MSEPKTSVPTNDDDDHRPNADAGLGAAGADAAKGAAPARQGNGAVGADAHALSPGQDPRPDVDKSARNVDNPAANVDNYAQNDGLWPPPKLELASPASTRPPARTYLEQKQERTERLLGRYCSLADLLGLDRLPQIDCRGFKRILDVGTREGNWAIAMARKYPGVWVLGIDGSPSAIARAENVAVAEGLCNIAFLVRQVEELLLTGFTVRHFNLVRLHCLGGGITFHG